MADNTFKRTSLTDIGGRSAVNQHTTNCSYASGCSNKPLIGETIGRYFDGICQAHADSLALISRHQNIRWTYRELKNRVDAFSAGLLGAGLQPGDRIGIWASNCAEWLVTQYSAAMEIIQAMTTAAS
jgi:fatty-acyl-CoA synthase